jgi:hypothetical protein
VIAVYGIVLACMFVFLGAMCGADRQQTLDLSVLGAGAVGVVILAVALVSATAYAYDSRASTGDTLLANMRRDAPVKWLKRCAVFVLTMALLSGISSWYLCRIVVPYMPGKGIPQLATIEDVKFNGAGSAICTKYAVVLFDANPVRERICLETGRFFRRRITRENLGRGDRVSIQISHALFGSAVRTITKVGQEASVTTGNRSENREQL